MFIQYEKKVRALSEYEWIKDGKVYVSKGDWSEIKLNYSREEIVAHLREVIVTHQLETPYNE